MNKKIEFPQINPILETENRPFWSVMITSYKRTVYLEECLKTVLSQNINPEEMQIEVVDDHSPNYQEIEKIVQEVGQGRISFYHQPKNIGIYDNWNTCIQRAYGHWIHILSDDDLVMPDFYKVYRYYLETYQASVVIAQSLLVNEKGKQVGISQPIQESDGILDNALRVLAVQNVIRTPGIVVARKAYEKLGGFTSDFVYAPDWEMWTRLAASVKIAYVNQPYSSFRLHEGSETSRLILSGDFVTDTLAAAKVIHSRIPDSQQRKAIQSELNQIMSAVSYDYSRKLIDKKSYKSAFVLAMWSFRLRPSKMSIKNLVKVLLEWLNNSLIKNLL